MWKVSLEMKNWTSSTCQLKYIILAAKGGCLEAYKFHTQ